MEYSNLFDLIKYIQYGTKLHIGVLFLGNYGNDMTKLPHTHEIHEGVLCDEFKLLNFNKCYRCRNRAINKAIKTKKDFGGVCINGIYEYTRPVIINNEVASIIFIGNIYSEENKRLISHISGREHLTDTLEKNFSEEKCRETGKLIESYIKILLQKYTSNSENNIIIENIKNYIEDNLEFDIRISHIAGIFHYNEQYFGRYFKKETGISLNDYINLRRLKKAVYLLKNSNDTVLNIATRSGFNNVTYFNRIFKKTYKVTPSEYRNRI